MRHVNQVLRLHVFLSLSYDNLAAGDTDKSDASRRQIGFKYSLTGDRVALNVKRPTHM